MIKFRGKCAKSGEWSYGHFALLSYDGYPEPCIFHEAISANDYSEIWSNHTVIKEGTEGYTLGDIDDNGNEIFTGDICKIWMGGDLQDAKYIVDDLRELYAMRNSPDSYMQVTRIEVIGNIYDNPELG